MSSLSKIDPTQKSGNVSTSNIAQFKKFHTMPKILVIPLYFGNNFKKEDLGKNMARVVNYATQALVLFRATENFALFYPKDEHGVSTYYIDALKQLLPSITTYSMDAYTNIDDRSTSSAPNYGGEKITEKLVASITEQKTELPENIIIIVSVSHVANIVHATREVFGHDENLFFNFDAIGGVGNTECFYYETEKDKSIVHLRFHVKHAEIQN